MRSSIHRFTAPAFNRLPDVSELPIGRLIAVGVIGSLIVHALFFLGIILIGMLIPKTIGFSQPKPLLKEIELSVIRPQPEDEPPPFTMRVDPSKPFLNSTGLAAALQAALNPVFQSGENMVAASELPATGDAPLPTQEGREDRRFHEFSTQHALLGRATQVPLEGLERPWAETLETKSSDAETPAQPLFKPQPVPKEALVLRTANLPIPAPAVPTQSASDTAAQPTMPSPLERVVEAGEDEIALSARVDAPPPPKDAEPKRPHPIPIATPAEPSPAKEQPPVDLAMLAAAPKAQPVKKTGFQPELRKTKQAGGISNLGKAAVDATGTPLGKYREQLHRLVSSRWQTYIDENADVAALGEVETVYRITPAGKISGVRVLSNTGNSTLADICVRALRQTEALLPPPGVHDELQREGPELSLTFTYYPF